MCTLQSILHAVQCLIYSRGAVVSVRQLAQLVRNSLHGVQSNCGVPPHPRRHAELDGHVPLHPEKERILCVAPVQERGPTQHPTRESHRRTEISATRANRNVVDRNVRIVSPQTHTVDVGLRWRTRSAAMTPCTHTSKYKAFEYHSQTQIQAPETAVSSRGEYLAGQQHRHGRLAAASSDAAAAEISNVRFVLPTPEARVGSQRRAVQAWVLE